MAVNGNPSRAANVGHHLDGTIIEHADNVQGFRQNVAVMNTLTTEDPRLDSVIDLLSDLIDEQRITNILLEGLNQ